MRLSGYVFLTQRYNRQRFFESLLIILAIGLGVAVIVATHSYIYNEQKVLAEMFAKDTLHVRHSSNISHDDFFIGDELYPFILQDSQGIKAESLTLKDYFLLRDGLEGEAFVYCYSKAYLNDLDLNLPVVFQTPEFFDAMGLELERGEFFTHTDFLLSKEVAVIGADLAKQLFPNEDPIGQTIHMRGYPSYQIIGLLKDITKERFNRIFGRGGDNWAFVPYSTHISISRNIKDYKIILSPLEDLVVDEIVIEPLKGNEQLSFLKKQTEEILLANNIDYISIQGPFRDKKEISSSLLVILLINVIAGLILLVASINIMNLFLARTLKREKYYGLSLALGANRKTIVKLVFAELAYLCLAGGFLGLGLAFGICKYINHAWLNSGLSFGLLEFASGLGISLLLAFLASIYPVLQLRRINPNEMLGSA